MIEIFKTNLQEAAQAKRLQKAIGETFKGYRVHFDLEDCDHILRIESINNRPVQSSRLIRLVKDLGYHAEILEESPAKREPLL